MSLIITMLPLTFMSQVIACKVCTLHISVIVKLEMQVINNVILCYLMLPHALQFNALLFYVYLTN